MYSIKMRNFRLLDIFLLLSFHRLVKTILFTTIYVKVGKNVGVRVRDNFINLLHRVDSLNVIDITGIDINSVYLNNSNSLLLLIGNSTETNELIPQTELDSLEHESYIILSTFYHPVIQSTTTVTNHHVIHNSHTHKVTRTASAIPTLACNGLPLDSMRHTNISFDKEAIHYGAVLAGYVCLERLVTTRYTPFVLNLHAFINLYSTHFLPLVTLYIFIPRICLNFCV